MGEDRYSYGYKDRIHPVVAGVVFLVVIFTLGAINYLTQPYPLVHPRVSTWNSIFNVDDYKSMIGLIRHFNTLYQYMFQLEKQYPQKGVVHYTFEPANSWK